MEMESSRRPSSFDRSRELGLKRPRLAEEPNLNTRPFQQKQQRPANSGSTVSAASARFRANSDRDRESDESVRGSYQQPSQLQQHQELISQYKAALAELTFNSKPIITNLTIIAGENTHAAKAIAGTICANIIEVPSDQKLPSLYLLDSIVKNIGRDYIKYFASKLPEVFCKAYRQVDSPVHASMQHLFGTWKGVFPPQPLQIIERELGFLAASNGSSSSTITRADSQTQRQPHSIHVNPKYLEARRLQQSGRNVQQPQREELRDTVHEKPLGAESEDHEYGSGLSRHITSRLGKSSERIADHSYDKQWSSAGRSVEESISSQRNGVNSRQSTPAHMASRSANVHLLSTQNAANRGSRELPRSWKNTEEEEYMWDDLNPGVADHLAVDNIQKDYWTNDGLEKSEFGGRNTNRLNQAIAGSRIDREIDSLSSEQVPFDRQRSSWQSQEQLLVKGSDIPLPRTAFQSHVGPAHATGAASFGLPTIAASGSAGSLGQRHGSSGKPLISQPSSRDPRLNVSEKEQAQANSLPLPNRKPALHHSLHLDNNRKSEPQSLQKMTSMSSFRAKQYNPPAQQLPLVQSEAEPSSGFQSRLKQLVPSGTLNPVPGESAGQLNASALLAAILKTGVPPVPLTDGAQPSSSSGSSHSSLAGPRVRSSSSSDSPLDLLSLLSQIKTNEPPQSSGPPPTSSLTRTANSDSASSSSNPFDILSTLVAKGLITPTKTESAPPPPSKTESAPLSASKTESAPPTLKTGAAPSPSKIKSAPPASTSSSSKSNNKSPIIAATTGAEVPSVSSKSNNKSPIIAESTHSHAAPETSKSEIVSLIGFEFKPDVLRQFHSSVVDGLFEDLPHSCSICGLRLKLKERLDRHLEWHALKQSEVDKSSGTWYADSDYWVTGKAAADSGSNIIGFSQEFGKASEEDSEPMVPADESHCVCLLCGELFEDFYSLVRDEWMFKGAVYMTVSSESGIRTSSSQTTGQGVIVHAKCMVDDSFCDLNLPNSVKLEKDV